jgi:membrane protease YdiL (CAAX protease family)
VNGSDQRASRAPATRIFLILTFVLTALLLLAAFLNETFRSVAYLFVMWAPGVSAVVTLGIHGRSRRELGLRWGNTRYALLAIALPIGVSSLVYGGAWLTGLGGLDREGLAARAPDLWFLLTLGVVFSTVESLGEELGWRGFLVVELRRNMSFTRTAVVSGLIWCAWHYPSMFVLSYGGQAPHAFEVVGITLQLMAASFVLSWLRLRSGSVWPAAIFHGVHNIIVPVVLDPVTADTGITEYVVGEFGFGLAIAWGVVGYVCWRLRHRLPRVMVK